MVDFVTYTQKRWTGGIRFILDKFQLHLDPGPGAIVRSVDAGLSPQKVNVLLVSHSHPDHYGDAEIFIEAMTDGTTKKKGILIAPHSVLYGNEACEASISKYHQGVIGKVFEAKLWKEYAFEKFSVKVTKAVHSDPDATGYSLDFANIGKILYTSDTEYFEGIEEYYSGTRLLILCVMRPKDTPWKGHLSTNDAIEIMNNVKPEKAIITHFGMRMVFSNPERQAALIERETKIPTKAAFDGMRVTLSDKEINYSEKRQKPINEL